MQEIKITDEMKADAMKLIEYGVEFRKKYGLKMVTIDACTYDRCVRIYGDTDDNGGFNLYKIYDDGYADETYIKGESGNEEE